MRNLTAQELAAIEIIRRGEEAVTGIQGTFNGEDAIFIVQVSTVEGSDELRIYPLAMLLRDEDMPFVGGPHEEHPVGPERVTWPDQSNAATPVPWPDDGVVSPPAGGWPDEAALPPDADPEPPTLSSMSRAPAAPGASASTLPPTALAQAALATRLGRFERNRPATPEARLEDPLVPYLPDQAEEARVAEEARRAEEEARVAEEEAAAQPPLTRADVLRQRREAAARRDRGTTKRRRWWPTLELSVRTSRILLAAGRTLIAFGTLMLLFVAYELWGTGIAEARAQKELKRDFEQVLATPTTTPPATTPGASTTTQAPAPEGEAVALIEIPKLGLNKAVVSGVGVPDLKKGPGHYPDTPLPGEAGNAAIAGHRTTYGAPFNRLDELEAGDPILVTTRAGRFRYVVATSIVVKPTEVSVLNPSADNRLTLTTCNPKYSARQRLIVVSRLVGEPPAPPPSPPGEPQITRRPTTRPDAGLSGESAARRPTLVWGAIVAAVALLIWWLGRLWRRWPVYLLGTPVFLIVLFIFFENVSRLLPANV